MIESFFGSEWTRRRLCQGAVGAYMPSLAAALVEQGYKKDRGQQILRGATAFGLWLSEQGIALEDAGNHVGSYLHQLDVQPNGRKPGAATCVKWLLQVLGEQHVLGDSTIPSTDNEEACIGSFDEYLRRVANVVPGTRCIYIRFARRLLKARFGDQPPLWSALTPEEITAFVFQEVSRTGGTPRRGAVTATRAFLRFLSFSGHIAPGLVGAVPTVRQWKLASLPRNLSSAELECVLSSVNENSLAGLRDKAILLILARLGLRAGEVSQLNLEDIDWQEGRIVIRAGKTRRERCLPLSREVGSAIVEYLKNARPKNGERALFIKAVAPRHRIRPCVVAEVTIRHLKKAGVQGRPLGSHVLRHTVATELVRHGATFKEAADVLGHQLLSTTQVYAKLDLGALSEVALPWPGAAR